jgi:hypothetical protein
METWIHEDMETWTWRHQKDKEKNGSLGDYTLSVYRLLIVQTEVCRLSVC